MMNRLALNSINIDKIKYINHRRYIEVLCPICKSKRWVKIIYIINRGNIFSGRCMKCNLKDMTKKGKDNRFWKGSIGIYNGRAFKKTIKWGRIRRSRFSISEVLGRPLKKTEIIHHINGNKLDDRLKNLALFKSSRDHIRFHKNINKDISKYAIIFS